MGKSRIESPSRRQIIVSWFVATAALGFGLVEKAVGATMTNPDVETGNREKVLNSTENLRLAKQFLEKLGSGASADEIASLCTLDLDWNVPGDPGALPWIGHKKGRTAMSGFVRDSKTMMERVSLDIQGVFANEERAVILGHLQSRINATGRLIDGAFAIFLTFSDAKIASFLMLENSFAVSMAARR
ncbi:MULTISPECIES: nuclear transport factor 2 family protein [Paraburkholderia]|uniref:nuclear transport factor 2 family protein n=1 Tax=Paraburkholderia TaxID=1822464 RepID=UPI00225BE894|nr:MULTISPECIES: nuclear transport factor 2 family protein [Paraburkholderia]MCX4163642.1 nuclear transport factor 2 family protein [Paraburkholderia megapolitana]MDN7159137.1 nuclear transport factor 2 family protein [Paraburkholderia sp. CHISQ3]MDQ6496184.1 nuclear transport factor 2 family protein [Paraburkholderia megapolitana]